MSSVATSINTQDGSLLITWVAPDNQGDAIDSYVIEIADSPSMNNWYTYPSTCPGTNPTLVSCSVPMLSL